MPMTTAKLPITFQTQRLTQFMVQICTQAGFKKSTLFLPIMNPQKNTIGPRNISLLLIVKKKHTQLEAYQSFQAIYYLGKP